LPYDEMEAEAAAAFGEIEGDDNVDAAEADAE
jgi:hypothetical protein